MTEQALAAARASISQQRTSFDRQTIKDAGNTPVGGRSNEQQTPPEQELAKSIILGAIAKPEFTKGLEDSLSRVAKSIDDRSGTSTLTTSLNNTPDLVPKLIASLQAHSDFLDPQLAEEDHMLDGILSLQHMQAEADKVRDEVPKNV
jgi:glutamine synthetase adenylyltransferase